jgi:phospholipase C
VRRCRRSALAVVLGLTLALPASAAAADAASSRSHRHVNVEHADPAFVGPLTADQTPAARLKTATPIKHVVTLMQENHSFDNYFGTYPGADGIPAGTCMPRDADTPSAGCVRPYHLGNKPIADLGHNSVVYDAELAGGKMTGFVSAFARQGIQDPTQAMGHYDDRDIPWYWNVADNYVLFDRHFTSAHGGSISNHMFWVTGQSGIAVNKGEALPAGGFDVPTIFDRLQASGVSWKFYVQNYDPTITFRNRAKGDRGAQVVWVPLLAYARYLDDPELFKHLVPIEEYYDDLASGTLPAVSYLVPSGASEHPPGSIAAGEAFVRTLVTSLQRSSAWSSSAFMWTYDDWGGWYDHVRPPAVDAFGYGFRAPMLLISPYAKQGHIDHNTADFTSQLAFIERNWNVASLTARDAKAYSLTDAFDFTKPPRPPIVVSSVRHPAVVVPPRRNVVYASYSAALGIFLTVVLTAAFQGRRRTVVLPPGALRAKGLPLAHGATS